MGSEDATSGRRLGAGGNKRYLRADPTTLERAGMSPGDIGISPNHSILQDPSLHCPNPAPAAIPPRSGVSQEAETPCRCNQGWGCCALPPDPPNSSMPPEAQQDGQGRQLPTTAPGAGVGSKGNPSHGLQHSAQHLTLSLLPHLQEASLNHTVKNSSIFPPRVNQEPPRAGQPSQPPPGDIRDGRDTPGTSTTHCQVAPGGPWQ